MAERLDRFGETELIGWVDTDFIRLCPVHRKVFDADPIIYYGAGRTCNCGGLPLVGYLAKQRQPEASQDALPPWMGLED